MMYKMNSCPMDSRLCSASVHFNFFFFPIPTWVKVFPHFFTAAKSIIHLQVKLQQMLPSSCHVCHLQPRQSENHTLVFQNPKARSLPHLCGNAACLMQHMTHSHRTVQSHIITIMKCVFFFFFLLTIWAYSLCRCVFFRLSTNRWHSFVTSSGMGFSLHHQNRLFMYT